MSERQTILDFNEARDDGVAGESAGLYANRVTVNFDLSDFDSVTVNHHAQYPGQRSFS